MTSSVGVFVFDGRRMGLGTFEVLLDSVDSPTPSRRRFKVGPAGNDLLHSSCVIHGPCRPRRSLDPVVIPEDCGAPGRRRDRSRSTREIKNVFC